MERFLQATLLLVLLFANHVSAALKPSKLGLKKFSSLVVFGDSYTDNGVRGQYRPGPNGTIIGVEKTVTSTGGRVWPQYVRQYAGVNIYDYAVSGAVCSGVFSPTQKNGVKESQMPLFLADNAYVSNTTGKPAIINPSDETAYAIWIGTNDLGNRAFLTELQPKGVSITEYVDCVYEQLDRLHQVGARHFVLLNIAPLDLCPQYALPENEGLDSTNFWTDKSVYNANITQSSEKMRQYLTLVNAVYNYETPYQVKIAERYPHSTFAIFDVHSLLTDVWKRPSLYLNGTAPLNVKSSIVQCGKNCSSSEVRDSYMWYDALHPSEQTDRVIAREFVNVVRGNSTWVKYWST